MATFLRSERRNLAALGAATALLLVAYVVVPHPVAQFGAWLVVFTIWMVWFVFTFVDWLSGADY